MKARLLELHGWKIQRLCFAFANVHHERDGISAPPCPSNHFSSVSRMQESADVSCTCKHHLLVSWMEPACFQLSREVLVFPSMMGSSLGLTDWFP